MTSSNEIYLTDKPNGPRKRRVMKPNAVFTRPGALSAFLLALFLFATTSVSADEDIGLCCLCDSCALPIRSRADVNVDDKGTTCDDLALQMADPTNGSKQGNGQCKVLKNRHYDRCCNPKYNPLEIVQAPTPAPGSEYPSGNEPVCHLCHDASYPKKQFTTVAVLQNPEAKTCKDLYWLGLRGMIEDRVCNPMQDYYDIFCGCNARGKTQNTGKDNVGGNDGGENGGDDGGDDNQDAADNGFDDGTNGGAAPDNKITIVTPQPTPAPSIDPPKKTDFAEEDDKTKLYNEDDRGNLDRKRRLGGKHGRRGRTA